MNFLNDELAQKVKAIEGKILKSEQLSEEDLKMLLLNLLQIEDAHEKQ
jgi:hypothetical protein